ncbi:MAG: addiction module antidote protein, HigA family [Coxiella sp. RIFCSPHIGHO2_12_FULL_44_14]|nr:MAG: addiction module antidote protein, HigA family [Coxiella sp. RIFCSPHIGHO2_12_FULL_44_14]
MSVIHAPLHPGEIVKNALFDDTELTVTEAAVRLKVDRSTLSRLLNGHAGISPDMAYRLSLLLNTSAEMWLNLQRDYDLWQVKHHSPKLKIEPLKEAA